MTKTLSLFAATAALAIASTSLAPAAVAGGGVRLQFGYPLGSFVARPCSSCGSSSYGHRHHHHSGHDYAAARRAAARAEAIAEARREKAAAARAEAIAEARREKASAARAEAIAEARREKAAEARAEALAEARREKAAEARRLAKAEQDKNEKVEEVKTASIAPDQVPLPVRPEAKQADVAVGEPQVILIDPATTAAKQEKTAQDKPKQDKVAVAPAAVSTRKTEAPVKPLDCKKFVPSAGLTITVPCT